MTPRSALLAACAAAAALAAPAPPPATLAWPLHGSEGDAGVGGWASSEVPVGAHWPFGSMRLGADTSVCWGGGDWWFVPNHYGGYFFNDTCVRAFSHTHAQGAGLGDGGVLGVIVARAAPAAPAGLPTDPLDPEPWRTPFAHGAANETARPGYYAVALPAVSTLAEMTVSGPRAGLHRYTCAAGNGSSSGAPCVLVLNACHRTHDNGCGPGSLAVAPQGDGSLLLSAALTESGAFAGDCGGVPVFFVASISAASAGGAPAAPSSRGFWADGALLAPTAANASSDGKNGSLGLYIEWPAPAAGGAVVMTVRVALSYVSAAAAAANLAAEQQGGVPGGPWTVSFEQAQAATYAAWAEALSAVVVNDVGYTDEDVEEFRRASAAAAAATAAAAGAAGAAGSGASSVGAPQSASAARAAELARDALKAWRASGGGGGGASGADAAATAAMDAAAVAAVAASQAAAPQLRAMPPLERLGSFYSSLYHVFAAPTTYSDADGGYVGLDRAAHGVSWRGGEGVYLSDLSLWDVYRTQMPMLAVLQPVVASDIFESMLAMFAQTNFSHVPHWVWANCETGCMPGSHGLAVLADFLTKGVVGPNASVVYRAAAAQLASQDAADDYNGLGFVPVPDDGKPDNGASLTLEYAFDDFVGSVVASAAGQAADAARWLNRSRNYRNVFNAAAGGMCPRFANGSWPTCPPLDLPPILLNDWYTEGDGLQWTFAVPHDVAGLVALFPSPGDYVELLRGMMGNTSYWAGSLLGALPNPWLWIGNEPSLLLPLQFNWVQTDAWRTQFWTRWTLDTYFQLTPDGVPGNDDASLHAALVGGGQTRHFILTPTIPSLGPPTVPPPPTPTPTPPPPSPPRTVRRHQWLGRVGLPRRLPGDGHGHLHAHLAVLRERHDAAARRGGALRGLRTRARGRRRRRDRGARAAAEHRCAQLLCRERVHCEREPERRAPHHAIRDAQCALPAAAGAAPRRGRGRARRAPRRGGGRLAARVRAHGHAGALDLRRVLFSLMRSCDFCATHLHILPLSN